MKRVALTSDELEKWRKDQYILYASQSVGGKRLRMSVNTCGEFLVVWGDDELYRGNDQREAIDVYNADRI